MTMTDDALTDDLTPRYLRAARALLAWSQQDLAKVAGVATSTIADFERGKRTPVANNLESIRDALERAGIYFTVNGPVIGSPLPAGTTTGQSSRPIRWVSASDLANWADQTDGAFNLPTLTSHLIRATHGTSVQLRFPADEGVRHPGWDGVTQTRTASLYVPHGPCGWEIGTQRSKIPTKAMEDYEKRTNEPEPLVPADAAFVFVTPRHWPHKDQWVKERQEEGPWREVRVYDADDLVHWIEQTPAVGLWLATRLGYRPEGVRELDELWEEWSHATQWPLTEELILSGREQDAAAVQSWLRGAPSVLSVQTNTTEEGAAFFHAALDSLPGDEAAMYKTRSLVATTTAAARALKDAPKGLILALTEPEPGLAHSLAQRGHHILQIYNDQQASQGEIRTLARPSRDGITRALANAGIAAKRAQMLARDSARNLAVLRRLIPSAPGRIPDWAQEPPPRALVAALLVGGWNESVEADRACIAEIADEPYDTVVAALSTHVGKLDSPLQKVGTTWRIASPLDAWFLLALYLTSTDITRFETVTLKVLGSADPRFEMDPGERWMASVKGVQPDYSNMLRQGLGQVLILLAVWGERIASVPNAKRHADRIVENLLDGADTQRWWSLSNDLRLLAEASPKAFLDAVENSLNEEGSPLQGLFEDDAGVPFGNEYLSDLLWALESLAWSPDLMPRVSLVLARLDTMDNRPERYANRPANSLRNIHIFWNPQTNATVDQRLRVLDLIRDQQGDAAWKLMLGVLPQGHDTCTPSPMPRWRDFTADQPEAVTWGLIGRGAAAITQRLIEDADTHASRWSELLDRFADLAPDPDNGLAELAAAEPAFTDKADRAHLRARLRRLLHHHRQIPDAEWALSDKRLGRLEAIYHRLAPSDELENKAWLFSQSVVLPNPSATGWEAEQRDINNARQEAAQAVFSHGGVASIIAFAALVDMPGYIGNALYNSDLSQDDLDALLAAALQSSDAHAQALAHGLIISAFPDRKEPWAKALIATASENSWGDTALLTILHALPANRWVWDHVALAGSNIDNTYWRRVPVFRIDGDREDIIFAIGKLNSVQRARPALELAGHDKTLGLPSDLLVQVLQDAVHPQADDNDDPNNATMFQHYVTEVLQVLDERGDVDQTALAGLEWQYLPVLDYSSRPARVLPRMLAEHPQLFIDMLCTVFKASDDSGVTEEEPEDSEQARAVASQAFRLLQSWSHLPGGHTDGTVDGEALEDWIKQARLFARDAGRDEVADDRIGNMLSASPVGADGNWPAEAVRDALDLFRSNRMITGFITGTINRRGVTTRALQAGGTLEREEAAKYRAWAKAITYEHPHTAKALDHLAEDYERDAQHHDEDAERLDWEH